MTNKRLLLTSALWLCLCVGLDAKPNRDDDKPSPAKSSDFEGKVVAVLARGGTEAAILEEVRVRHLGEKAFLVGKRAMTTQSRWGGVVTWIAIEDVNTLYEFKTLPEAREAIAEAQQAHAAPPGPAVGPQGAVAPFPVAPPPGPNAFPQRPPAPNAVPPPPPPPAL
jgi:hypothetical protein